MAIQQAIKISSTTEQMPGVGDGQSVKCVASSYTTTVAAPLNEVIQSALIQKGSVIVDVTVTQTGMGAAGAFSVGYTGFPAYFSAAAAATTAGVRRMDVGNLPLVLTTNDTIDVFVTAAGATAGVTYSIMVYFLPLNA